MPVYEYACTECGEQLEVRQSFTDAALTECPVCSGRLRKVLSPVGVVFKGSGFYRTDSRAGANGTSAPRDGAKDGAGSGKGKNGTKSEAAATSSSSTGSSSNGSSGSSPEKAAATST